GANHLYVVSATFTLCVDLFALLSDIIFLGFEPLDPLNELAQLVSGHAKVGVGGLIVHESTPHLWVFLSLHRRIAARKPCRLELGGGMNYRLRDGKYRRKPEGSNMELIV